MSAIFDPLGRDLPTSWTLTTIGQLCDENGGEVQTGPFGSQLHAEDYVSEGVPSVMPKDIVGNRISTASIARVSEEDATRLATYRLRVGDIIYARRGDIGRCALVTTAEDGWLCGTGCLRIRLNTPMVAPEYLLTYLGHPSVRAWVESKAQGATMLNLNTSILRAVPIRFPSLPEQRRIIAILGKSDAIRCKRKEAIALTEGLLHSVFLEMFGDPVTNPMGWPRSTFGSELELLEYGPRFYNEKYSDDGVRIVRITDLDASGYLDFSAMPRLVADERDRLRYALRPGDVIFARSGATVGKTALSMPGDPESIPGAYFIRLRFKPEVRPLFARQVLASERIQKIIAARSRQSAQQNFSGPGIRELPLPVPPRALQERLEQLATARQAILECYRRADTESQVLFNSLLDQAFTGRSGRAGVVG